MRLIVLCTALSLFASCEKILDRKPDDSLTRDEFFKTEADANAALVGVYDALQGCVGQFLTWGESRSDLVTVMGNTGNSYPYFQLFINSREISNWTTVYQMIGRANIVIEDVPGITKLDKNFTVQESDATVGQARFLRALGYFYLVRTFKEVPLVLEAPNSDDVDYRPAKSSAEKVLDQIEEDLTFAEQSVNVQYARNVETRGRVTKGAVNSLQADVYLWRAKYVEAAAAAKKVLDNNTLYSLVDGENWFTMFSVKNTNESIFEVQFDYTLGETNSLKNIAATFNINKAVLSYYFVPNNVDEIRGLDRTFNSVSQYWKYKGLSTTNNIERPTNDPNFIIYRLADVMLMRAEALAHLGFQEKEEAVSLLHEIRERASIDTYAIDGNASTSMLVDLIMKERAMELAMEGKRWFDLVRVATNDNRPEFLVNLVLASRTVGERSMIRARIIDPRSWYLPILLDELNRNPNLVQNPYYN